MAWAKKINKFVPGIVCSNFELTFREIMINDDGWKFFHKRLWHNKALRNMQAGSLYHAITYCRVRMADLNPEWKKQQRESEILNHIDSKDVF